MPRSSPDRQNGEQNVQSTQKWKFSWSQRTKDPECQAVGGGRHEGVLSRVEEVRGQRHLLLRSHWWSNRGRLGEGKLEVDT